MLTNLHHSTYTRSLTRTFGIYRLDKPLTRVCYGVYGHRGVHEEWKSIYADNLHQPRLNVFYHRSEDCDGSHQWRAGESDALRYHQHLYAYWRLVQILQSKSKSFEIVFPHISLWSAFVFLYHVFFVNAFVSIFFTLNNHWKGVNDLAKLVLELFGTVSQLLFHFSFIC